MRLFIDLQGAQTYGSKGRGIGRYSRDLCMALAGKSEIQELHLGWNCALETPLDFDGFGSSILGQARKSTTLYSTPYGGVKRPKRENNLNDVYQELNDLLLSQRIAQSKCRHVLMSSVMETDELDFHLPKTLNFHPHAFSYSIVYDLIPLLFKHHYLPHISFETKYMAHLRTQLSADVLFAISEKTRLDLINILGVDPERIVTIGAGIDLKGFGGKRTPKDEFLQRFKLIHPFVLFMGGDEFRKNIDGFVAALAHLPPSRKQKIQALIVGPVDPEKEAELRAIAKKSGLFEGALIFAQRMAQEDLHEAYHQCAMTVIPSLYEGFGLPVLEAMASQSAVIASQNSSMSEILTAPELLFDPRNPRDIASRIEFVFHNSSFIESYKKTYQKSVKTYTWDRAANLVLDAFKINESRVMGAKAYRGFRPKAQKYSFVILDRPSDDLLAHMTALCIDNTVHVYCENSYLSELTLSAFNVSSIDSFEADSVTGPLFISMRTVESLYRILDICALQDMVLLMSHKFKTLINKRLKPLATQDDGAIVLKVNAQKLREKMTWFQGFYQIDSDGILPLNLNEQQLKIGSKLNRETELSHYMELEADIFEKTDPVLLSRSVRRMLSPLRERQKIERAISRLFGEQCQQTPLK